MGIIFSILNSLLRDDIDELIAHGTDEELHSAYDELRVTDFYKTGKMSVNMKRLSDEMTRRANERWMHNPNRNTDPNYRWTDANRWE